MLSVGGSRGEAEEETSSGRGTRDGFPRRGMNGFDEVSCSRVPRARGTAGTTFRRFPVESSIVDGSTTLSGSGPRTGNLPGSREGLP